MIAVSDYFVTGTIDPQFLKFIPVKDGFVYLFMNLSPVWANIHIAGHQLPTNLANRVETVIESINNTNSS